MIKFDLDLEEHFPDQMEKITSRDKREAKQVIADLVKEEILSYVAETKSPVDGHGVFEKLSKDYAKKKKESGRPGKPDLVFYGDMLEALEVTPLPGSKVRVTFSEREQGEKAEGHCQHLKKSRDRGLPMRRFIPARGEVFKSEIMGKIEDTLGLYTGD